VAGVYFKRSLSLKSSYIEVIKRRIVALTLTKKEKVVNESGDDLTGISKLVVTVFGLLISWKFY
jgi:hypothetical protein